MVLNVLRPLIKLPASAVKEKEVVTAELPFYRSQVALALKKELEKTEKEWEGKEVGGEVSAEVTMGEHRNILDRKGKESDLKIVFAEYRALLDRVNVAVSNHTGKALAELEGLEDIA
ncbi:hypothetical protein TrLO_g3552 [Triparma laevis f. longispina]|uniref:Uncharacterized protein n=1 Tax=Triparma laevis f. longispina TaxID=1714387 RepID=A0A9W6ZIT8_9STRA|nr:hypothetical protein TrLO_g3552 [Triparma laevis f. longispina]